MKQLNEDTYYHCRSTLIDVAQSLKGLSILFKNLSSFEQELDELRGVGNILEQLQLKIEKTEDQFDNFLK